MRLPFAEPILLICIRTLPSSAEVQFTKNLLKTSLACVLHAFTQLYFGPFAGCLISVSPLTHVELLVCTQAQQPLDGNVFRIQAEVLMML